MILLRADGFVNTNVFGGIGKREMGKTGDDGGVRVQVLEKREMLVKNEEPTISTHLKSSFPVCGWVCAFADVLGGIGKGEVGQMLVGGGGDVKILE